MKNDLKKELTNGNEKLQKMIELLKAAKGEAITTDDLSVFLNCNRNSVNNYYKRCIAQGIKVKKTQVGHKTGYFLEENEIVYDPMTVDMVWKYKLMQQVIPGKEKKQDILGSEENKEMGHTRFYDIINELIEEGEIVEIDGRYYPGRKNIPVNWRISEEKACECLNKLAMIPPGYHSQSIVESVYNKINAFYESEDRDEDSYVILGRSYTLFYRIHDLIQKLRKVDYINNLIRVEYIGNKSDITVAVGMIVYSVEKDKLYLIGERMGSGTDIRNSGNKKELTVFLDVEKIIDVRKEKGINRIYRSKRYTDMYDRMFSIGNSKLVDAAEEKIEIIFDNDDYIKERLKNLCEYRKNSNANIEEKEDKLIYHDSIIGADDFFRFLRQFTGQYEIGRSKLLKKKKKGSIKQMLGHYTEVDANE